MTKIVLALVITLGSSQSGQYGDLEQAHNGPRRLGPYSIDQDLLVDDLLSKLDIRVAASSPCVCFTDMGNHGYMWIEPRAHHPRMVGSILISSFPNCVNQPVHKTRVKVQGWKTGRGIGLGSSARDVLAAYGPPLSTVKVAGTAYRWVISGDYIRKKNAYRNVQRPEIGDAVLVYANQEHVEESAAFGIKNGLVVWISIGNSE